jgi:hypothetical protein
LHEDSFEKYFLFLYLGLKDNVYYWELINTIRKILLLSANAFLTTVSNNYKGLAAVIILIFALRIQQRLLPYK